MPAKDHASILAEIESVEEGNLFLRYITRRLRSPDYRGWHVSQHNRYTIDDIEKIVRAVDDVVGGGVFAIFPGDDKGEKIPPQYAHYAEIVRQVKADMGRGTVNSVKKNFFPDMDGMGLLHREKIDAAGLPRKTLHGSLTAAARAFLDAKTLVEKYKIFTDGVDNLFGNKISDLAELLSVSDYAHDKISIDEFMFILSDKSESLNKIEILDSYRSLKKFQQKKARDLIQKYANPRAFEGDKTAKRDFHNWKNQIQQMMGLLKTTVYFEVELNRCFRLNTGRTGFFRIHPQRSAAPKRQYFFFHEVRKKENFELHHIVPISAARNQSEAKDVDHHKNLIYIHREKHLEISKSRDKNVVLDIDPASATFSDFDKSNAITAKNKQDALYSDDAQKVAKVAAYNAKLLKSIYDY